MLTNAMWFSVAPETENSGMQYGFIILNYEEAAVGALANLFTFPMVFFLVFLFKYSKARVLRDNRLLKALMDEDSDDETDKDENTDDDNDSEEDDNCRTSSRPTSNISSISTNSGIEPPRFIHDIFQPCRGKSAQTSVASTFKESLV